MTNKLIFLVGISAIVTTLIAIPLNVLAIKLTTTDKKCIRMMLSSLVNDTLNNTDFGPNFRIDTAMSAI